MKKNKILLSAISGSVVLATIPALATSCNKNQPSVVEDIDFSQVTLEQHKYLNDTIQYKTLLTYSGFELKTGNLDNLTVEVANIQGFDYGDIYAVIYPTDGSKFAVAVVFDSYINLDKQNPKFDLVFKEESTSWKTKTISGFSAYFTTTKLELELRFNTKQTIATTKNSTKYVVPNEILAIYDDEIIPPSDSFEVEFIPYLQPSCNIVASLTTSKDVDEPYLMYLNFDITNISADETVEGYVIFRNKYAPEWYYTRHMELNIKTSIEDNFVCDNFADGKCDLIEINCCDPELRIPSTIMHEGTEYTITSINVESSGHRINPSVKSLFIPNTIQQIEKKNMFDGAYNLENIQVESPSSNKYSSRDADGNECNCIIDTLTKTLMLGTGKTTIPSNVTSIGNKAFAQRRNLLTIELPDSITSIGEGAFVGCADLKSIKLPSTLNTINDDAFISCLSLESIDIPSSITSLPRYCFNSCMSLQTINLPDTLTSIDSYCFGECSSLQSIELPESLTSLGNGAFINCISLETIKIPSKITQIYANSFKGCTSLSKIELPDSLLKINSGAFNGCTSLESITLPNSLTTLGTSVFEESGLKSLSIGPNVATIESPIAAHCPSLKEISVDSSNETYASNGLNCITSKDGTTLVAALETTKFDQLSITKIGHAAFGGADWLTGDITLPSSINTIEEYAFAQCYYLQSIDLSSTTITSIPQNCFGYCSLLKTVKLNNLIQSINEAAFEVCFCLNSINLPSTLTFIGKSAFRGCSSLEQIELPNSISTIRATAFENCGSLTSITLPSSLTSLESNVFYSCDSLASVDFNGCAITKIPDRAFAFCSSLESITLPSTIIKLGTSAFRSCHKLKAIDLSNITSIGEYAFANCESLESITLNDSITKIDQGTFEYCSSLKTITLPYSLETINEKAFYECKSLESISIPATVTYIGADAFVNCESLTSATFAKTDNWYQGLIAVEESVMADPSQAAEILKEGYILTREEE